eukprot:g435.t1
MELEREAMLWCSQNGVLVRSPDSDYKLQHAPVSMLPSPFPRKRFQEALALAQPFNALAHLVSADHAFINESLQATARSDAFTGKLLEIFNTIRQEGSPAQDTSLGALRSDYMVDTVTKSVRQIELNTVSSSFHALTAKITEMHRYLSTRPEAPEWLNARNLPRNSAAEGLVRGIAAAWREYGDENAVVLMIVQPNERNTFDQDWAIHGLWHRTDQRSDSNPLIPLKRIRTLRRSLREVYERGELAGDGKLTVDGIKVGVTYYRAGYVPTDYPSECEWDARYMIERADCIKSPSAGYQLVGTKKIQQILATSGVVEDYLGEDTEASRLVRSSFAGLHSLSSPSEQDLVAIDDAMTNPDRYVLKPQREGGGHNMYGDELREKLRYLTSLPPSDDGRDEFILMERIFPATHRACLLRGGASSLVEAVSELGVYSTILSREGREVYSEGSSAGHLLRTKVASSDEGGVAAGFAVLDSPLLVDGP